MDNNKLEELYQKINKLEKENKEIKDELKNAMKLYDYKSVKFILSIVKTNISRY